MILSPAWLVFSFAIVLVLMAMHIHIAVVLILVGFFGITIIQRFDIAVKVLKAIPFEFATS